MEFLEKDLETIIFNANKDELEERGLFINGNLKRQLRIGNYGIADLVTFTKPLYVHPVRYHEPMCITVYELKKDKICISAFLQALNYVKGIKSYINKHKGCDYEINYRIILIGKTIDMGSSFIYIPDIMCANDYSIAVEFKTYEYKHNGIWFNDINGYKLTNEGF